MTKEELIKKLVALQGNLDREISHSDADNALLDYINDKDITEAYEQIERWYA